MFIYLFIHLFIYFACVRFIKENSLIADTTCAWTLCPFSNFIFEFFFIFTSVKWFDILFHKSIPLNSVVFNPYMFVLELVTSSSCVFLKLCRLFFCLKWYHVKGGLILLRHWYISTIRIWKFCVWIFFFLLKSSSSSYDYVSVSYISLRALRLPLIFLQNVQISGQYLKFDEICASANTWPLSRFRNFLILRIWK